MHSIQRLDRRSLLAGSVVAGSAAVITSRFVLAQDSTPGVSELDTEASASPKAEEGSAELQERLETRIAVIRQDVDAVRSIIDATTIDEALATIETMMPSLVATTGEPSINVQGRYALAAIQALHGTRSLLLGQIMYSGLPSEEAHASQSLARVYQRITAISTRIDGAASAIDVSAFVSIAQTSYTAAYDQFIAGAWAQARQTGIGAVELMSAAAVLISDDAMAFGQVRPKDWMVFGRHQRGEGMMPGDRGREDDAPVDLPAPDFTSTSAD